MAVKYGKFELPTQIKIDESNKKEGYVRFIAEAFERGFGHTVGNALRRIMLTSMESPAIISVRIEGVPHEYMAIEGIVEDMTHIILNLKGALIRRPVHESASPREVYTVQKLLDITDEMIDRGGGKYVVTVKDLFAGSEFESVNGDHLLFT